MVRTVPKMLHAKGISNQNFSFCVVNFLHFLGEKENSGLILWSFFFSLNLLTLCLGVK